MPGQHWTEWEGVGALLRAGLSIRALQGTASSEVNATEEMSTLVNYVEPVKFKSFEAARSECRDWQGKVKGEGRPGLPGLTPAWSPREEQVLRDVVIRGDQGNGAADQEPHGVCGVSFQPVLRVAPARSCFWVGVAWALPRAGLDWRRGG